MARKALGATVMAVGLLIIIYAIFFVTSPGQADCPPSVRSGCNYNGVIVVLFGAIVLAVGIYVGGWQKTWWGSFRWARKSFWPLGDGDDEDSGQTD